MNFKMCSWKTKQEMKEKQEIFYETRRSLEELIVIVDGSTGIEQEDEKKRTSLIFKVSWHVLQFYHGMWCVARFGTICTISKSWKALMEEC